MDTSTSAQQSAQPQQPVPVTPKPETLTQLAQTPAAQPTQPISGHPEQGPIQSAVVSESQGSDETVQPAKQEISAPTSPQAKEVEIQPTVPEVAVEKSVEQVVEKSADHEKPELPKEVQKAGVTLSGPGVPIDENAFGIKSMPMTYDQAVLEEKKHPKLNDSKHWLVELVEYVWRKLDPDIGKKGIKN